MEGGGEGRAERSGSCGAGLFQPVGSSSSSHMCPPQACVPGPRLPPHLFPQVPCPALLPSVPSGALRPLGPSGEGPGQLTRLCLGCQGASGCRILRLVSIPGKWFLGTSERAVAESVCPWGGSTPRCLVFAGALGVWGALAPDASNWEGGSWESQECSSSPTAPGGRGWGLLWSQTQTFGGRIWVGWPGPRTEAQEAELRKKGIPPVGRPGWARYPSAGGPWPGMGDVLRGGEGQGNLWCPWWPCVVHPEQGASGER